MRFSSTNYFDKKLLARWSIVPYYYNRLLLDNLYQYKINNTNGQKITQ